MAKRIVATPLLGTWQRPSSHQDDCPQALANALERAQNKAGKIAEMLVKTDLLVLDELGYLPFSTSGGAKGRRENSLPDCFLILLHPSSQQTL